MNLPKIAIAGASGFIGSRLLKKLEGFPVVAIARKSPQNQTSEAEWRNTDLFSLLETEKALKGVDIAIYLVHSMLPSARLTQGDFADFDLILADNFSRACVTNNVKRIIYLGGLIPDNTENLSPHLKSRLEVEQTLRESNIPLTVLRAGIILGAEGSSFQIMTRLVQNLPAMICPSWTKTKTQAIDQDDVVAALHYCLTNESTAGKIFDIGAKPQVTYLEMMKKTAECLGLKRRFFNVPFFTPKLSRLWVSTVTGAPKNLVKPLVQSLKHEMIVSPKRELIIPDCPFLSFDQALKKNLDLWKINTKTPHAFLKKPDQKKQKLVRSIQRLSLPPSFSASKAADLYHQWLARFLPRFIRTEIQNNTAFLFLKGIKKPLMILELSKERSYENRPLFYIRGGVLSTPPHTGRFEFREVLDHHYLLTAVHNFKPRLPWFLYKITQAQLHVWVMKNFGKHLEKFS